MDQPDRPQGEQTLQPSAKRSGGTGSTVPPPERNNSQDREKHLKRSLAKWNTHENWMFLFQMIVAIAAIIMAEAARRQAVLIRASNEITRRALAVSETNLEQSRQALVASSRAWLIAIPITEIEFRKERHPNMIIRIANVGHSPAVVQRSEFYPVAKDGPPQALPEVLLHDWSYSGASIGPGFTAELGVKINIMADEWIEDFESGKSLQYIRGRLEYRDQFGVHMTPLCSFWDRGKRAWDYCPGGNDLE